MNNKYLNLIHCRVLLLVLLTLIFSSEARSESILFVHSLNDFKARSEKVILTYPNEKNPQIIVTLQSFGSGLIRRGIAVYRTLGESQYILEYFQFFGTMSSKGDWSRGVKVKWNDKDSSLTVDFENGDPPKIIKLDNSK